MSLYGIGCLFVREDDFAPSVALSPKTELELSDIVVTSVDGDFLALLPKNWTFIEKRLCNYLISLQLQLIRNITPV